MPSGPPRVPTRVRARSCPADIDRSRPGAGHDSLVSEVRSTGTVDQALPSFCATLGLGDRCCERGVHGVLLRPRTQHFGGRLGKFRVEINYCLHNTPPNLRIYTPYISGAMLASSTALAAGGVGCEPVQGPSAGRGKRST